MFDRSVRCWAAAGLASLLALGCQGSGSGSGSGTGTSDRGAGGSVVGYSGGGSASLQRLRTGMSETELTEVLGRPDREEVVAGGLATASGGSASHRLLHFEGKGRAGQALVVTMGREGASWVVSEWSEE